MVDNPSVSVVMITYSHEKYIKQAIEGVLMQECDFDIELIVANDSSPDNTDKIVKYIIKKSSNGNWVKYFKHDFNKGMMSNFVWALNQARGKYIALCEGDDYWTDTLKLQKQFDFMENNNNCSLCFNSVNILTTSTNILIPEILALNKFYSIDEVLMTKVSHTCSFFFRNELLGNDFIIDKNIFGGDVFLILYMAEKGLIFGLSDDMAVYRKHESGISTIALKNGVKHYINFINQFIYFKYRFRTLDPDKISLKIADNCFTVVDYYIKSKNIKFVYYILLAFYYRPKMIYNGFLKIFK